VTLDLARVQSETGRKPEVLERSTVSSCQVNRYCFLNQTQIASGGVVAKARARVPKQNSPQTFCLKNL